MEKKNVFWDSWKTTVGGIVFLVVHALYAYLTSSGKIDAATAGPILALVDGVVFAITGYMAKDADRSGNPPRDLPTEVRK